MPYGNYLVSVGVIKLDEENLKTLIEADSRSKSAIKMCEEVKEEVKSIKIENKAIYELTYSVKAIADNMCEMKNDIAEMKQGQKELATKVDDIESKTDKEDANKWRNTKKAVWESAIKETIKAIVVAAITVLATMIATGKIG